MLHIWESLYASKINGGLNQMYTKIFDKKVVTTFLEIFE